MVMSKFIFYTLLLRVTCNRPHPLRERLRTGPVHPIAGSISLRQRPALARLARSSADSPRGPKKRSISVVGVLLLVFCCWCDMQASTRARSSSATPSTARRRWGPGSVRPRGAGPTTGGSTPPRARSGARHSSTLQAHGAAWRWCTTRRRPPTLCSSPARAAASASPLVKGAMGDLSTLCSSPARAAAVASASLS